MNRKFKRMLFSVCAMLLCCITFFTGCNLFGSDSSSDSANSSEQGKTCTVKFDLCTTLSTNKIMDRTVQAGETVSEPTVAIRGENPDNLEIVGWYQDKAYTTLWDFDFDLVTSDLTLYAKWESRYSVAFYLGDNTLPVATSLVKGGRKTEPCEDKCYGYEVMGYYTSREYTEEFDFDQPITQNTSVYIQVGEQLSYDAIALENAFAAYAGKGGIGGNPTAGSIAYEEKNGESYARVDFGYSNTADPYIAVEYTDVDISKSQSIEITFKNLGDAYQMALLWVAKNSYGYLGKSEYSSANSYYYDLGSYRNMSEDDEWVTIRFPLAELNTNWRDATSLYSLRVQSCYNSYNPTENPNTHCKEETVPNVMLIKSIKGVYDAKYDPERCLITYHLEGSTYTERVDQGATLQMATSKGGYEVLGYYTDVEYQNEFDCSTPVTQDMDIYVKVGQQLYYDGAAIAQDFSAYAGRGGAEGNPTAGSVTYEEKDGESYVRADFGYSNSSDPYIAVHNLEIDITRSQSIEITMKNLGDAYELAFFWTAKNGDTFVGQSDFSSENSYYYNIQGVRNMSEDDEWVTLTFNLAETNLNWRNSTTLCSIRLQSSYNSFNPTENPNTHCKEETVPNVMLIKSIKGVFDAEYDPNRCLVTYHIGDNVSSERVDKNEKLVRNDAACVGYKVLGYYTDEAYTTPYDFDSVITGDVDLYVKTEDYLYFSAASIATFKAYKATDGNGEAGNVTLSENGEYARVDYGYAPALADAHVAAMNVQIDRMGCSKLEITMKNLGSAASFAIYWQGICMDGSTYNSWNNYMATYVGFSLAQRNMSEDGEWVTLTLDLSANPGWMNVETITAFRIESNYRATSEADLTNVWLIKEIKGIA